LALRAFADPEVAVVHFFGVDPVLMLDAAAKAELWNHIEPIVEETQSDPFAEVKFFGSSGMNVGSFTETARGLPL
jgi:hypothetical protein